ncbi:MAG: glycosyltransferase [Eubacteriales bacterium]|nr:glycosyltransferase [Eubacteriales bacterium]
MKIVFVINNLYTVGNGLSKSVRRTIQALREKGMEVRVLSAGQSDSGEKPFYQLKNETIPVFAGVISKQGYKFAKTDKRIIEQAVSWADIIHLEEPFALEIAVCKIADKQKKPCVATYHLHPENLFASVYLERSKWFNYMTMLVWRNTVFNHCRMIQCPTENVRQRLERWRFQAELRVISNGITAESCNPVVRKHSKTGTIHILSVGRFSREKDQDTLLNAMKYIKQADRIQLHFAGKGPTEHHLKKKAAFLYHAGILKKKPVFGFYSQEKLRELFAVSDLYIHSAIVEVEGMSCMEAVCTGIVPIIATGKLAATSQFTDNENSLYPAGDAKTLAARIDYWIEHPAERIAEAQKYIGIEKRYLFENTIRQTIRMYEDTCSIYRSGMKRVEENIENRNGGI